ncbi:8-oxo-dGTP pyrophosphatase MutT (NUDIX family) [Kribbella sp. VKM Ac-2527]|uniref:8-oxo-dGTP pyrophosphatase MutT (NUDIX family) n=1 Tax=Kribbella caucasensis TaxID=2512215 RepID=A0A4R6JI65_9ACTN|nr:NUDIX domain-containing protein [Kribbella sp. VKM Ac-2527]TDO35719.1 8-oxo-dGTP pyrophosphatase MutT (NUDIX family) [Kribbella sp. VKM Ac-2527]
MTLHQDATDLLTNWNPPDAEQAGLRDHYVRHLAQYEDGLARSCRPEHVTASALVVDLSGSKVLLTLHRTVGRWLQLGGHCEPRDTTLAGAALREATEESGLPGLMIDPAPLQLSRHELLVGGCKGGYHLDVQFLVTATEGTEYLVSEESHDLGWFGVDALPDGIDETVEGLVNRAYRKVS